MIHATGEAAGRPLIEGQRSIYSAKLKANMPIFEAGPHFIESAGLFRVTHRPMV
jgi:hypothetical protein